MAHARNWRRTTRQNQVAKLVLSNVTLLDPKTKKKKPVSRKLNIDEVRRRLLERNLK